MRKTGFRAHVQRLGLSLLAAFIVQLPLAWAIVYFNSPGWQGETSVIVAAPAGVASNVAQVRIENDTHFGVRWVSVAGFSAAYRQPVFRTDEEQLFTDEPTWPFPPSVAFPGLTDPSQWPTSAKENPSFLAGTYGESYGWTYAIGWPFLCATGRTVRDPATNRYSSSGVLIVEEPKFRRWTHLGCVPLCYRPRWEGVIGNTLVLGGAVFLMWTVVVRGRGALRRRRGLCVRCGYDLSGTPVGMVCPECGGGDGLRGKKTVS